MKKGDAVRLAADPDRVLVYRASRAHERPRRRRAARERMPLRVRLALYDLDGVTLLVLPAVLFVIALFVYPFVYGFVLSFQPKKGDWLANYAKFFSDPFLYDTIEATLSARHSGDAHQRADLGPGRAARAADAAAGAS